MSHRSPVLQYASRGVRSACLAGVMWCLLVGPVRVAADQTTGEVSKRSLPGANVEPSLLRNLKSPSADARWRGLDVFGRDLFAASETLLTPVENAPVGPDYVLGPGDQVQVY